MSELPFSDQVGIFFVGSCLYGTYFVLFTISSLILHGQVPFTKGSYRNSGNTGTSIYLGLGYVVFILITTSWILLWVVVFKPEVVGTISEDSDDWGIFLYVENAVGWFAQYIAEWIVTYRLYIILGRKKAVLWAGLGLALVYGVVVTRLFIIYHQTHTVESASIKFFSIGVLSTNAILSAGIIWRIWTITKPTRAVGGWKIVRKLVMIFGESAALYTTWMIVYVILYSLGNENSHILLYGSPSMAGIATMLVNVRVGLGWAAGEQGRTTRSLHHSYFTMDLEAIEQIGPRDSIGTSESAEETLTGCGP